ncbi:MAG TPA: hypothetical protein IAC04_06665 [Candidatus Coprenecus stercoravium]|uniref:BACON domain-containing protein n=1 Tax=Candidatus Coprenecus stercoravium TaxID=2840735 RepID=A0A9D2GRZ3_9BACT|nr:hypothetical protein [Candidatus Coprenecus stercoravium]
MKKITSILLLAGICLTLLCSCRQDEPVTLASEIKLNETELEISSDGGNGAITYSILNPVDGVMMEASSEAGWLGNFDTGKDNVVTFKVEPNADTSSREAVILLEYASGKATAEVTLTQLGRVGDQGGNLPPFEITVTDIGIETATANFIPRDKEMPYAYMSFTKDEYEALGSDGKVYEETVAIFWEQATSMGLSIDDYMSKYILAVGDRCQGMSGLRPGAAYYVCAVGMDETANQTSDLVKTEFATDTVEYNGAEFTISHRQEGSAVIVEVVPSSDEIYYYWDALRKSDVDNPAIPLDESLEEYFYEQIEWSYTLGIPREETMRDLLSQGVSLHEFKNLNASEDYVIAAMSVTLEGYVNSAMTMYEFSTPGIESSDNELTLTLSNVTVNSVDISVTTTNDDSYALTVLPVSDYPDLTPGQILEEIEGSPALASCVYSGDKDAPMLGLAASTEYYALLFGYEQGCVTTDLVYETFVTLEDGNPENLAFEFEFSEITSNSLLARIIPNPDNGRYFFYICESWYDEELVSDYVEYMAMTYISMNMATGMEDFLLQTSRYGTVENTFDELLGGTEYKVFTFGVYPDGTKATDIIFSQPVNTLPREVSDVTINLICDKYFDGDELVELYPQYSGAKGQAAIPVRVETTGDVVEHYYHVFVGDVSNPDKDSDDALINVLTTQGGLTSDEAMFYGDFGSTYTVVGVAKGRDGKYGNVYRKAITFDKAGCSPIEEFEPVEINAPKFKASIKKPAFTVPESLQPVCLEKFL